VDSAGSSDRFSSSVNLLSLSASTRTPSVNACLVIAGGRRLKTSGTNSNTYGSVNIGGFTKIDELFTPGTSQAGVWYYSVQTTAASMGIAAATSTPNNDISESEGGFLVSVQPLLTSFPPLPGILLIDQRNNPLLRM
jgi:hypothetical protein